MGFRVLSVFNITRQPTDEEQRKTAMADRALEVTVFDVGQIIDFISNEKIDFVYHDNDYAALAASELNHRYNLFGLYKHQISIFHDKLKWSEFLRKNNLFTPEEKIVTDKEQLDSLEWDKPFIVKPSMGTASKTDEPYGYKFFYTLDAFRNYLKRYDLTAGFLNPDLSAHGSYFLQEEIEYEKKYCFNLVIKGKCLKYIEYFEQDVDDISQVIDFTKTIASPPVKIKTYIDNLLELLVENYEMHNFICSCELIESTEGEIMVLDMNTRFSGIWNTAIFYRKGGGELIENIIQCALSERDEVCGIAAPFIRKKVNFPSGKIKNIEWFLPEIDGAIRIFNKDRLVAGEVISTMKRNKAPELMITCQSIDECLAVFDQVVNNTKISYE